MLTNGQIANSVIHIVNGIIAKIELKKSSTADIAVDVGYIVPGFIDLQVNGGYGADFTLDGTAVADVAKKLPATGVTAFLPTIITAPFDVYSKRIEEIRRATKSNIGAQVLGVHIEGPYLSPVKHGMHAAEFLRAIDIEEISQLADPSIVRLFTLAPELPGAIEAIRLIKSRGIVVGGGLSNATYEQAMAGFEAGIGWGMDLFNVMSEFKHREPGMVGAFLSSDVPASIVADGIHVHPAGVKIAYRAKGSDSLMLVSNGMAAMGMTPGVYKVGNQNVTVDGKSARLSDGKIAGSIVTMDQSVKNAMTFTDCSINEAVKMASFIPARVLGLQNKGRIKVGCDADIVVLDKHAHILHTIIKGNVVYSS